MDKKRIIFVQNVDFPQQGAIDIFYYAKYLARMNVEVIVICREEKEKLEDQRIQIIQIWNTSYVQFICHAFFRIRKMAQEKNIDYVYFFAQHPGSVVLQFFVKYILKIKTIYDIVSWPIGNDLLAQIWRYIIRAGVFLSEKFVIDHQGLYRHLWIHSKKPSEIIWIGYDHEKFKPMKKNNIFNQKDIINFTYIWSMDRKRELVKIIEAFKYILTEYPATVRLNLIWSGNDVDHLKNTAWRYDWKWIYFFGKKPHSSIPDYIHWSDIMVSYVPKKDYFEYQPPTKLIEYLACNKLVMATNTIAQSEILRWYENMLHEDNYEWVVSIIKYNISNIKRTCEQNTQESISDLKWSLLTQKLYNLLFKATK
jgi:glycosyltransferase involved in cell wall biosynthesis